MNFVELKLLAQIQSGSDSLYLRKICINLPRKQRAHYLGMSSIARHACELWINYYQPDWSSVSQKAIPARTQRIFRLGDILEEEIVEYIIQGGGHVEGSQDEFSDFNDKYRGHCDGKWNRTHILEIKSGNEASCTKFLTRNLLSSHPDYYTQLQSYMYYSGIPKAIIVFYNKNTSEIHCLEVLYNKPFALLMREKASSILEASSPKEINQKFKPENCCTTCIHIKNCK